EPLGLDDGTPDAVVRYNDLRTIYDSYRNRFWILAGGGNSNQPDPAKGRGRWVVAISIDQNPLDGWYLYWWDVAAHWGMANDPVYQPGDVGDYPAIGIDSFGFHETNVVRNQLSNTFRYYHVVFFPADPMAAGNAGPIGGWQYWDLTNPDGSPVG